MGKYTLIVAEPAKKHLRAIYKSGNKTTIKRLDRIFKELSEHPYFGFASPEQLKYKQSGNWSRQIDKKNRVVYSVDEENATVLILSAKGHYDDK